MEYSGLLFLYVILPLFLLAYFLIPDVGRKNWFLIAFSLLIYSMGRPLYLLLLLILSRMNFNMAQKVRKGKKSTALLPVALNLAVLFILKYLDQVLLLAGIGTASGGILVGLVNKLIAAMNEGGMSLQKVTSLASLGISFFAITSVAYILDIYRGKFNAEKAYKSFLLYMFMFPKLFQGPIVRYDQVYLQLKERRENIRHVFEGFLRFVTGLGKKVLLADYCGRMIGELAEVNSHLTLVGSWLTAVLFLFRIYYDFSGCCDMAVGLGRIFGFRFPENFNLPFTALSVTEFCQRWNLTLNAFFREHVYVPIKGKKDGALQRITALLVTVMLTALWHGGSWNFLVLGLYFFIVFVIEEQFEGFLTDLPYILRRILTILILILGGVIFANPQLTGLGTALKAMIGDGGVSVAGDGLRVLNCIPLVGACWFGATSYPGQVRAYWKNLCAMSGKQAASNQLTLFRGLYLASCVVFMIAILWWCTVSRIGTPVQPSIFMNL